MDKIKGYAALTFTEIENVAEELAGIVGENGTVSENFCLQEVKNTLRQFEDYTLSRDIRMAESVIADSKGHSIRKSSIIMRRPLLRRATAGHRRLPGNLYM